MKTECQALSEIEIKGSRGLVGRAHEHETVQEENQPVVALVICLGTAASVLATVDDFGKAPNQRNQKEKNFLHKTACSW